MNSLHYFALFYVFTCFEIEQEALDYFTMEVNAGIVKLPLNTSDGSS